MGTSIHKANYSKESPMKMMRQPKSHPGGMIGMMNDPGITKEPNVTRTGRADAKSSKKLGLKALLNPAGAIVNKMGMGDTAVGQALNMDPLSLLNR